MVLAGGVGLVALVVLAGGVGWWCWAGGVGWWRWVGGVGPNNTLQTLVVLALSMSYILM